MEEAAAGRAEVRAGPGPAGPHVRGGSRRRPLPPARPVPPVPPAGSAAQRSPAGSPRMGRERRRQPPSRWGPPGPGVGALQPPGAGGVSV